MFSKIGSFKNIFKSNANDGGIWSWNNNGNWQPFDATASKQIDNEIRNQWLNTKNQVIVFPLTKGPWFSQSKNRGIYFCNVQLNASRDKITSVIQQNTKTGFARNMTRNPLFAAPQKKKQHKKRLSNIFSKNKSNKNNTTPAASTAVKLQSYSNTVNGPVMSNDDSVCWSWRNDYQWEAYDTDTIQQIETAYKGNAKSVVLDKGPFFGAKQRKGMYMVKFDEGNTIPPCYTQVNTKTSFGRQVARTERGIASNTGLNDDNEAKQDNHEWRQYYRPMTSACFEKLKDKEKMCNICFLEFEEKELFENQCEEFKALIETSIMKDEITNNAMDDNEDEQDKKDDTTNIMNEDADEDDTGNDKEEVENDAGNDTTNIMNEDEDDTGNDKDEDKEDKDKEKVEEFVEDSDGDSVMVETTDNKEEKVSIIATISEENDKEIRISRGLSDKIENDTIIHLSKCGNDDHYFHTECIVRWLNEKGKCCHCQTRYAVETGNQPLTGRLSWSFIDMACSGFKKYGSIKIGFEFEDGVQGEEDYHPGEQYQGDYREAYFPNNEEGRQALELTKIAWKRRLIFTVGTSLTTKRENCIVWTSIHFKTRTDGGQQAHGWPDKTYFDRFKKELEAKGVTCDDIDDDAKEKIKNGY